jgi:hypothetical protein
LIYGTKWQTLSNNLHRLGESIIEVLPLSNKKIIEQLDDYTKLK